MASNPVIDMAAPAAGDRQVGGDIRALRKSRDLTLADLARRIGRSVSWLSQVERGQAEPGISDLRRIAAAFDVPLGFLFRNDDGPAEERGRIVRAAGRRMLGNVAEGLTEELLSPDLGGSFEMFRSVFAPGTTLPRPILRQTEEAGYVVAGTLELKIGDHWFRLRPGDSFRFDHEPYQWRNPGDVPAIVIWVVAPPIY